MFCHGTTSYRKEETVLSGYGAYVEDVVNFKLIMDVTKHKQTNKQSKYMLTAVNSKPLHDTSSF